MSTEQKNIVRELNGGSTTEGVFDALPDILSRVQAQGPAISMDAMKEFVAFLRIRVTKKDESLIISIRATEQMLRSTIWGESGDAWVMQKANDVLDDLLVPARLVNWIKDGPAPAGPLVRKLESLVKSV